MKRFYYEELARAVMGVEKSHSLLLCKLDTQESQWSSTILSLKTSLESRGISDVNPNPRAED